MWWEEDFHVNLKSKDNLIKHTGIWSNRTALVDLK
jgi:hypothetical protein